jgi:predicted  nucleic acid-binding Zn-ribbon protein
MTTEIDTLRKEITVLSAKIEALRGDIQRVMTLAGDSDEALRKYCRLLDRDQKDAFDRIINLELTVFPNLQRDMNDVYKAIGEGEDKADNPLDRRGR